MMTHELRAGREACNGQPARGHLTSGLLRVSRVDRYLRGRSHRRCSGSCDRQASGPATDPC